MPRSIAISCTTDGGLSLRHQYLAACRAARIAQHTLAVTALTTLLGRGDTICLTAQNLIEFWSVASRPIAANGLGWPVATVRQEIDRLLDQFPLLEESPLIFAHWQHLVIVHQITGRRVHDARLVAVMVALGVTHLLTFNGDDFRAFDEIVVVAPADVVSADPPGE